MNKTEQIETENRKKTAFEKLLTQMSCDVEIMREIKEIEVEFRETEFDGLE